MKHLLNEKGISLVELLVSMTLLLLFVAVSIPLFTGSFRNIMWSGEKSEATFDAQDQIELEPEERGSGEFVIVLDKGGTDTETITVTDVVRYYADGERIFLDGELRTGIDYFAGGTSIGNGGNGGNGSGPVNPQDYVLYSRGQAGLSLPSGSRVSGNVLALSGDVQLLPANTTVDGDVRACGNVTVGSGVGVTGAIISGGDVELLSSNVKVSGDIHAAGDITLEWNATVEGSVYAGGDIIIDSGATIEQDAYAGGTVDSTGTVHGNRVSGDDNHRIEPDFCGDEVPPPPETQTFTAGSTSINANESNMPPIEPGSYDTLTIGGGGRTATFKAGEYVFNSISGATHGTPKIRLDLSAGERITVFVVGDLASTGAVEISEDGTTWVNTRDLHTDNPNKAKELAQLVYWEVHGNFTIATNNNIRHWFGTVLTKGEVEIASGFFAVGAFATTGPGNYNIDSNPAIIYSIADFALENW